MPSPDPLEDNLALIQRVIDAVCRRRCVFGPDAEDVRQQVLLRLAGDEREALRSFRGDSMLETYITVVATRICIDEIRQRKGRWRPSAAARRLGVAATCLEELVSRDGLAYEEAVTRMVAERVVVSRAELDEIWPRLPPRPPRVFVPQEDGPELVGPQDPERLAQERERQEYEHRSEAALDEIRARFRPEDQLLIRRLFYDGRTLAEVARELGTEQRPLYRRRDKLLKVLRHELEERGFRGLEYADAGKSRMHDRPFKRRLRGGLQPRDRDLE